MVWGARELALNREDNLKGVASVDFLSGRRFVCLHCPPLAVFAFRPLLSVFSARVQSSEGTTRDVALNTPGLDGLLALRARFPASCFTDVSITRLYPIAAWLAITLK